MYSCGCEFSSKPYQIKAVRIKSMYQQLQFVQIFEIHFQNSLNQRTHYFVFFLIYIQTIKINYLNFNLFFDFFILNQKFIKFHFQRNYEFLKQLFLLNDLFRQYKKRNQYRDCIFFVKINCRIIITKKGQLIQDKTILMIQRKLTSQNKHSCSNQQAKYFKQSIRLFFVLLYLLTHVDCLYNITILTTSANRHTGVIQVFKINSNYTKIYTIGSGAQIKVWDFTYPTLTLVQVITTLDGTVTWWNSQCLYLWDDGQKLFFGSPNQYIRIFSYNFGSSSYIVPSINTPSFSSDIYSVWVNDLGTTIYVSLAQGCQRLDWDGTNWNFNTPSILTSQLGTNQIAYVGLTSNQQKIITFDLTTKQIKIFKLNGLNYQLDQTIDTFLSDGNCILTFDEKFISCYGTSASGLSEFNNYVLDASSDSYANATASDDLTTIIKTQSSYMDASNNFVFCQKNSKTFYKYKFKILNNTPTYTILDMYNLSFFRTRITFKTLNTPYQLVAGQNGNIYLLEENCNNTDFIPHCAKCLANNTICTECEFGYDLVSDRCDYCLPGYFPNGIYCASCGLNCLNCSNLTACQICMAGWTQTIGICDSCAVGYFMNGSICQPNPCGLDCLICINSICLACRAGWIRIPPAGICTPCEIGFFDNGTECQACPLNCALCTDSFTCTHCVNGYNLYGTICCKHGLISQNSTCQCPENMNYTNSTQQCQCLYPYIYTSDICHNNSMTGLQNCVFLIKNSNGTLLCLFCSIQSHSIVSNHRCICKNGYQDISNNGTCLEKCGDGLVFESQCDDNNLNSNDGCSASCLIEEGYLCDIDVQPTVCRSKIMLRYSNDILIIKDKQNYEGYIELKLLNPLSTLPFPLKVTDFINNKSHITLFVILSQNPYNQIEIEPLQLLNIDSNYVMNLKFTYNFTIQNLKAKIKLNYEDTKYLNYTQQIKFDMKGFNLPFMYSQLMPSYKTLSIINYVETIFSILLLLIGLFTPKFIGLQMILTLQLIYLSQILISDPSNWPVGFIYLKNLKYSNGYNQILTVTSYQPRQNYTIKFFNINFQKRIIQNFNINYLLIGIIFIISFIFLLKRLINEKNILSLKRGNIKKNNQDFQQLTKQRNQLIKQMTFSSYINQKSYNAISQLIFWCVIPYLTSLFAFLFINNKYLTLINNQFNQYFILVTQKIIFLSTFLIIFVVCINNFKNIWLSNSIWNKRIERMQMVYYKRTLFCYLLIIGGWIILLNDKSIFRLPGSVYILILQFLYMLILLNINPYKKSLKIHTIGLLINNLVYLAFLIVINLINLISNLNEIIILALGYLITLSCSILMVLSIVRLYYEYRYGEQLEIRLQKERQQQQKKSLQQKKLKDKRMVKKLQDEAKKKLNQKQKIREKNDYLIQNQIALQNQQNLLQWLQKRNWQNNQKQQYYYQNYHKKPLSFIKKNKPEQHKQQIQQQQQQNNIKRIKNNEKRKNQQLIQIKQKLYKQFNDDHEKVVKKIKQHKKKMKRNCQYAMNMMKNDYNRYVNQQYRFKK